MGQEAESAERKRVFAPYQVNEALIDKIYLDARNFLIGAAIAGKRLASKSR